MAPTDARMGHVACGLADFCSSIDRFARLPGAFADHSRLRDVHSAELPSRARTPTRQRRRAGSTHRLPSLRNGRGRDEDARRRRRAAAADADDK